MKSLHRVLGLLLLLLSIPQLAHAHVGSKDVFEEATAGPYKLYVTIRMPNVIPGQAVVEVRSSGAPLSGVHLTPLPLTGEASKHPPTSDVMKVSADDPAFYTASTWIMAAGSWQIRFDLAGAAGDRTTSVPVPAVPISTLHMGRGLGSLLTVLGLFLVLSMAGVVAASVREARLQPGQKPDASRRRRAVFALGGSLVVMAVLLYEGAQWWNVDAASYDQNIYRPMQVTPQLTGSRLDLNIKRFESEDVHRVRSNNDFLLDHGHLMHLYAIRQPGMDAVFHLHPDLAAPGDFRLALPAMPPGNYALYGDIVHANGFPETLVTTLTIPAGLPPAPPGVDDAAAQTQPLSANLLGSSFRLPDGYTMVWDAPANLTAGTAYSFHFHMLDPNGKPATDMQPYMGMAGHAAFVKTDGTVFAHVHPEGSAAMAALMLANPSAMGNPDSMADMPGMTGMSHPPGATANSTDNTVEFPYGFPTPGRYRIFVQMKHSTTVETGVFDATAR
ncbi:hypothetical protein [Granulicella sp. dw_53]|uniref:hypothetical protein n=1 Tax=Granulicella sp. dw_53 TaxID=2719792 RepID=UPI001BD3C9D3|nr:hypothetical protein [Granulicella sp. dw_53]